MEAGQRSAPRKVLRRNGSWSIATSLAKSIHVEFIQLEFAEPCGSAQKPRGDEEGSG